MTSNFLKIIFACFISLSFVSCTKDVPPELLSNKSKEQEQKRPEMPDDSIHRSLKPKDEFHGGSDKTKDGDEKIEDAEASKYIEEADAADKNYRKTKSEDDKEKCIYSQLKAANFLMFEADLPPREKYKPALQRYRRVLELDPSNKEAMANKTEIEDIYKSMGKPIPN